jgi:hypothetical protein
MGASSLVKSDIFWPFSWMDNRALKGFFQAMHLPINIDRLNIDNIKRKNVISGSDCSVFGPQRTPFHASTNRSPTVLIWCFGGNKHANFLLQHNSCSIISSTMGKNQASGPIQGQDSIKRSALSW